MAVTARYSDNIDDSIGLPCDLSQNVLLTSGDVITAFYYTRQNLKTAQTNIFYL